MKHARDAAVGLLVTVLVLFLLELVLWAVGVGDPAGSAYLSRGFDPGAAYFVPDPKTPGAWRTQFLAPRERERVIPKKGDKARVLLFGGSNTNGFPVGVLLDALNAGTDPPRFEAFNLGCNGYGSARVSVLFHQAIERLDPDLVLVYVGHNEFIERSFQMDVERAWSSSTLRDLASLASRTRTFNALVGMFSRARETPHEKPEAWTFEHEKFKDLTYDQTLAYLDSYSANLRGMCRHALDRGIGVVLCTVIHNRFSAPFESTFPPAMAEADRARFQALRSEALALLPACFAPLLPEREEDRVHAFDWEEKDGPAERTGVEGLPGRRECSGPLAGVDPLLTHPDRWNVKVRALYEALDVLNRRALEGSVRSDVERAAALLVQALDLCPDHPRASFELALCEYALGRDDARTEELFDRAGRFDRAPRKGNGAIDDRVRAVARELPDVLLVDADRLFAERVPMGLVGWEQMLDHCHLNGGARRVLMADFAAAIRERWPSRSMPRK